MLLGVNSVSIQQLLYSILWNYYAKIFSVQNPCLLSPFVDIFSQFTIMEQIFLPHNYEKEDYPPQTYHTQAFHNR